MKKQPKLILRESAVWDMTRNFIPGSFVEMGAGTGHMASLFLARGFHGACHDMGDSSRDLIRKRFENDRDRLQVVDELSDLSVNYFDYLMAFEVLEHVPEDGEVLSQWLEYLKSGGIFIASVPAHQRKFGRSDEIVGHVRRYERLQMQKLLESVGLKEIKMVNYGYPITELTRTLSNRIVSGDKSYDSLDQKQKSILSAQTKPLAIKKMLSLVSGRMVQPFCHLQRWFYRWDLGDGLVVVAKKP
ncbi:methyltransferase family protein [Delftia acidovorans]|uniref:class I SAM-dependent methyltransferase n=1 Tax=Delftia acidovorans TaxID=80866 RepID=UPI000F4BAE71|nr:methyltransferase domain-containing protein [Delftia acidovorans]ROQ91781.1 methyltransferase family protein [Delftia acidovorans]